MAALVRARAHRETAVSDLLELKNVTEHHLRAANSNAFHLKNKMGILDQELDDPGEQILQATIIQKIYWKKEEQTRVPQQQQHNLQGFFESGNSCKTFAA